MLSGSINGTWFLQFEQVTLPFGYNRVFTGFILQGVQGIYAAHMRDVQLEVVCIATVASIQSLVLVACKFLTGAIYDKFGLRPTILI